MVNVYGGVLKTYSTQQMDGLYWKGLSIIDDLGVPQISQETTIEVALRFFLKTCTFRELRASARLPTVASGQAMECPSYIQHLQLCIARGMWESWNLHPEIGPPGRGSILASRRLFFSTESPRWDNIFAWRS